MFTLKIHLFDYCQSCYFCSESVNSAPGLIVIEKFMQKIHSLSLKTYT